MRLASFPPNGRTPPPAGSATRATISSYSSMFLYRDLCLSPRGGLPLGLGLKTKVSESNLRADWLNSLSSPLLQAGGDPLVGEGGNPGSIPSSELVFGIDPDTSGALALIRASDSGPSEQVFDNPHVKLLVGKKIRKRLDARSIVKLLHSLQAPLGTTAYIEQSILFPRDGKQAWWSGGYNYGLWIGILVASGFTVVPVPARLWKDHFRISGSLSTKGDSREVASALFPSLVSSLKRKKDHASPDTTRRYGELEVLSRSHSRANPHPARRVPIWFQDSLATPPNPGRADALLIAAYGKGLRSPEESSCEVLSPDFNRSLWCSKPATPKLNYDYQGSGSCDGDQSKKPSSNGSSISITSK